MSKEFEHCCICREKYNKNELHSCCNNHVFCSHCYRSEYYKSKSCFLFWVLNLQFFFVVANERKCPKKHCYSWVKTSPTIVSKCAGGKQKKMFPRPQAIAEKKKVTTQNSIISIYRGKSISTQLLSRKCVNVTFTYLKNNNSFDCL